VRRVCVFCGASSGRLPEYAEAARAFGAAAAARGLGIVYGGGRVGLMAAVADAALAGGGEVIGVIPQELVDRELAHGGLTELHVVDSLHERKALMAQLSDGFVALPGGFGTLDEIFETATLIQTGKIQNFPIVLVGRDFWRPLTDFLHGPLERMGLIDPRDADRIIVTDSAAEAVEAVRDIAIPGFGLRYRVPRRRWLLNE
jgi:uncharacterized protein (TIGR00730 family)